MTLTQIGSVSSEGGPLLIADPVVVQGWSGADGSDYRRACDPFDRNAALEGIELPLDGSRAIVWEMAGAGTADVFRVDGRGFMLVRYWLKDHRSGADRLALAEPAILRPTRLGRMSLTSGFACAMWAAVAGEDVAMPGDLTVPAVTRNGDGTTLVFDVSSGDYECIHDSVTSEGGQARRCHFLRLESEDPDRSSQEDR